MLKKIYFLLFLILLFFPYSIKAQENIDVYFFYSTFCPHCAKEEIFLDKLEDKYNEQINIQRFEVTQNQKNADFFVEIAQKLGADSSSVPLTVIGEKYFVGFYDEETTGKQIEQTIITALDKQEILDDGSDQINVPMLGKIDPQSFSLPLLTIVLGFLDGFNPCAMWALLFLITLLLGMQNRKRMWILGTIFVVVSALVYFLFMVAWLKIVLFLGFILWIRLLIAIIAVGGGSYNVKEYFKNKSGTCKVTSQEKRRRVFDNLKKVVKQQNFLLALLGIIALAFVVNLVELICSAGLPAVYTQVLALNNLATWQYYGYISLYIFFFMIDDLLVFIAAMVTLHITGLSTKYSRYSSLVGGLLMILIGLLLVFKPDWLMFA